MIDIKGRRCEMDKLYTVKEVAAILQVAEGTVRNYLTYGQIKYVKILGNTRIKKEELEKHIRNSDEITKG